MIGLEKILLHSATGNWELNIDLEFRAILKESQ